MSLLTRQLSVDSIHGVILTFEKVGDKLPLHTHTPADAHITICARGQVNMIVAELKNGVRTDIKTILITEGQCVDTDAGVYHEIVAVTDNARVFNIIKTPGLIQEG